MTLEELVSEYQNGEYKFYKSCDKEGSKIMQYLHFISPTDFFEQYMKYYKEETSWPCLLEDATFGTFKVKPIGNKTYYIRHPHQEEFIDHSGQRRGISKEIANQVGQNLMAQIRGLEGCTNFSQILKIVEDCKLRGFGELSIYDTAVRIGAFLGIFPDKVFLHAGTREGIKYLEDKNYLIKGSSNNESIEFDEFPKEFNKFSCDGIQNFACYEKEKIKSNLDFNKSLYSSKDWAITGKSAQESARLFRICNNVALVAQCRNFAESTIYKHLFQTKELNPYNFISDGEYKRINELRTKGQAKQYSEEINHNLTTASISAFYYIRETEKKSL